MSMVHLLLKCLTAGSSSLDLERILVCIPLKNILVSSTCTLTGLASQESRGIILCMGRSKMNEMSYLKLRGMGYGIVDSLRRSLDYWFERLLPIHYVETIEENIEENIS